jgi:ABC-type multidrug transport system ATPase subunit
MNGEGGAGVRGIAGDAGGASDRDHERGGGASVSRSGGASIRRGSGEGNASAPGSDGNGAGAHAQGRGDDGTRAGNGDGSVIQAHEVGKHFITKGDPHPVQALDGISLSVQRGTVTALVGPDGAGKTTFLRLVSGLMRPDAGQLRVLGHDTASQPQAIQDRISYMPQRFGLYQDLSVQENLDLYADLHGVSADMRRERYARLLEMTDLKRFTSRLAGKLSGGMKQKLGLACTLVRAPDLLLLDEPTVGVDPLSRRELWQIVDQMVRDETLTVLVATAYMDEAENCACVHVLHEGRLLAGGAPADIANHARGLCFVVTPRRDEPARARQARLLDRDDIIIDAVPRGGQVRFILRPGADIGALGPDGAQAVSVSAQLEDGFMVLLRRRGDTNADPNKNANTDVEIDAGAGPHVDADSDAGADAAADAEANANAVPHAHADTGAFSHADAGVHAHAGAHDDVGTSTDAGADTDADSRALSSTRATDHSPAPSSAPNKDQPAIEVRDLIRKFGDFTAVDRTTFSVARGEIFGLLGPNGAGKTTTFRMLCGLLPASGGMARVAGMDMRTARAQARARIGYVSQAFALYGNLSAMENLRFFGGAYGLYGARLRERIAVVTKQFSLDRHIDQAAGQLAGGIKQRLAMAVGLLHEPEILFLDEPTSGADPLARRAFWRRITALANTGTTIVITTHFMEEAEYCDRIVIQDAGKLLALGTPQAVRAQAGATRERHMTMEDAFIGIVERGRNHSENGAASRPDATREPRP